MATSANRDVKLTLSVDTLGQEGVKSLQDSILALAKQGGDAAPEFQRLADEVARLGQQSAALSAFQELANETAALTQRQEQAQASSAQLAARFDELRAATDAARTRQQQAAEALQAGQAANIQAAAALRTIRTEYDAAGKKTAEYRNRVAELIAAQAQSQTALIGLRAEQKEANSEVTKAEAAQKRAETAYNQSVTAIERVNASLAENARETQEAAAAAERLGVSTDDIAGSQGRLIAELNAAGTAAQRLTQQNEELAAATQQAAAAERAAEQSRERSVDTMREEVAAAVSLEASFEAMSRELQAYVASQMRAERATQEQAAAAAEMAEHNRLLAIQQQATNEALRRGADALDAERAAIREAQQAANLYTAAKRAQADAEKEAADKTAAAAKQLQGAFDALNVRSTNQIQSELSQVRASMETLRTQASTTGQSLAGAFAAGEARIKALELELRTLNGTLTTGDRIASLFKNSLGQIAAGNLIADAVGFLVNKVKELGVAFVTTIAQTEQFRRGLTAIYKDSALVQSQFEFLAQTANSAGVSVGSLQGAFVKFSAATKSANIPLSETNALFAAVTNAAGSLGLNGEQVTGMLEALGQMASKGTVSMEELRQQLGDRLPGAFSLVAQGLGVTEAQLVKLVESGSLATRDLFPALTKALGTMKGDVIGVTPAYEQLKNALTATAQAAGDAGWATLLAGGLRVLAAAIGLVVIPLQGFMELLFLAGNAAVAFYGSLKGDKGAWGFFQEQVLKSGDRMRKLTDTFDQAAFGAQANAKAMDTAAQAQAVAAAASQQLSTTVATTTAGIAAQKLQAELATAANGNLAATYVQLSAKLQEQLAVLEKQSIARDKEAKAVATEGQALQALVGLRASERDSLDAAKVAAENNAAALARSAEARRAEVEVLETQRNALVSVAQTNEAEAKARAAAIAEINKKIEVAKAEAAQADASAAAARIEVTVRQTQREVYEDNSRAIAALERAMINAMATQKAVEEQAKAGNQTTKQVADAQAAAAKATALYADALRDNVARINAESAAKQANYNVTLATLSVQGSAYERLAAAARASGDLAQATYYEIEAKRVQIQVTIAQAQAKKAEADATIAAAKAELEALTKTNSLTEAKRLEIEARIQNARAKAIEAGASADIVRALEAEINAIRQNAASRQQHTSATDSDTASRYRNRDAIDAQTAALVKQKTTSDGFLANADGSAAGTFNNSVPLDKIFDVLGRRGSLTTDDIEEVRAALQQATTARDYLDSLKSLNAGVVNPETYLKTSTQQTALQDILNSLVAEKARGGNGSTSSAGTGSAPSSTSHTVTVKLPGGGTSTINTASASDASSLVSMLKDLETAAGRAS